MVKGAGETLMVLVVEGKGGVMILPLYICILLTVSRVQRKTVNILIVFYEKNNETYNNSCATSYTLCDERTLYITSTHHVRKTSS